MKGLFLLFGCCVGSVLLVRGLDIVDGQHQTTRTTTTTTNPSCSQHRDCYRSHGFGSICTAGKCSSVGPPLVNPAPTSGTKFSDGGAGGAPVINCSTCPYSGYFDGCNTCACRGGQAVCTLRACAVYAPASCRGSTQQTTSNLRPNPTVPVSSPTPRLVPGPPSSPSTGGVSRPALINCSLCPRGYYDGCNSCSCMSGSGRPVCTTRFCTRYGEATCTRTSIRGPANPQPAQPKNPSTPAPPATTPQSVVVNCQTCPNGYYDGCNICGCNRTGASFCTLRYCPISGTPRCNNPTTTSTSTTTNNNIIIEDTVPKQQQSIDCRTCPDGYFDGCNNCICGSNTSSSNSGTGACTRMACLAGNTRPPKCN